MSQKIISLAVINKGETQASFPLYWVKVEGGDQPDLLTHLKDVLVDDCYQDLWVVDGANCSSWAQKWFSEGYTFFCQRQFLPGVTDNLARTVEEAIRLKGHNCLVSSGLGLLFKQKDLEDIERATLVDSMTKATEAPDLNPNFERDRLFVDSQGIGFGRRITQADVDASSATLDATPPAFDEKDLIADHCRYRYFHPLTDRFVVHQLDEPFESLNFVQVKAVEAPTVQEVDLNITDEELIALSKRGTLALSLDEMKTIQAYFNKPEVKASRQKKNLPSSPTDVELEIIAQTWSEHCKHKIFNAHIEHIDEDEQVQTIKSLYKTYIQGPTKKLKEKRPDLLSVFEDNSGVVAFDDKWAMCFKVETHNSPSALEPYGGALTGILGVNRDILGTGLGAKPIFNTDVFCFAYPSDNLVRRPKLLPAQVILEGVRRGVQDGGNKSGIATVNGSVHFDPGYRAKPLVFCGTGGIFPQTINGICAYQKHTKVGDTIVTAGGRVGKDGIHGATFSSEALNEDSPVSAVQIGDPFTQKRLLDFVLEARDLGLITGITDNGAGGLSSSVGEMARITGGAVLELDNIPLKYPGLAPYEIVISEAQERMTISTNDFTKLQELAKKHSVEITDIGKFDNGGNFEVRHGGEIVACLDLNFLHDGLPPMRLKSRWTPPILLERTGDVPKDLNQILLQLLASANISSREQIIRQYDHEVQGQSVVKPLMGELQQAPCDAAVIKPFAESNSGIVVSNGLCPQLSKFDPYLMAICSADEAVRNAVCAGANPLTLSLLDNFCWPDPVDSLINSDGAYKLAQLVKACQALNDIVYAYKAPLISGKDSMKNDFDDGAVRLSIPPTLLVSAMGKIDDVEKAVSSDFKQRSDLIYLLSAGTTAVCASQFQELMGWQSIDLPSINLIKAHNMYLLLHQAIQENMVNSCHDLSEGGLAVTLAECVFGSGQGADIYLDELLPQRLDALLFGEGPANIVVSINPVFKERWESLFPSNMCKQIGIVTGGANLRIFTSENERIINLSSKAMHNAWTTPLPFGQPAAIGSNLNEAHGGSKN